MMSMIAAAAWFPAEQALPCPGLLSFTENDIIDVKIVE
jgi:hypothetical protein